MRRRKRSADSSGVAAAQDRWSVPEIEPGERCLEDHRRGDDLRMALGERERDVTAVAVAEEDGPPAFEETEQVGDMIVHTGRRRHGVPRCGVAPAVVEQYVAGRREAGTEPHEACMAVHGAVDAGHEGPGPGPVVTTSPFDRQPLKGPPRVSMGP